MRSRGIHLLLVSLVFILTGCASRVRTLPTPTLSVTSPGRPPAQATPQPALLEKRLLVLEWPETIRENDSALIVLNIPMNEGSQTTPTGGIPGTRFPVDIPNIYDTHNIVAVARLDLAGMEAYRENIREPMRPGQPITFQWSIRANEAGTYQGVVWLRLELVPKNGGAMEEMLLLARPIEIKVVTILGMSGSLARFIGGAGLVISTVLGYPFIQARVADWLKQSRGKGRRPGRRSPAEKSEPEEVRTPEEK